MVKYKSRGVKKMNDKDFPHKLDEWITESVPVTKNTFNEKTGEITQDTITIDKKVKYIRVKPEKHRCKQGEHIFKSLDKGRYIFGCTKCQYSRQVFPGVYKLTSEGFLIKTATGERV